MSKGLEALEKLVDKLAIKKYDENGNLIYWESTTDNEYTIIEKELKEYENLKISYLENLLNEQSKEYIYKKLKALDEILALYDKWLGNEMSDFEFFTLLNEIAHKYDLLKEVLL